MNTKNYIGIGILIIFGTLSLILGYKAYQGISANDVAIAARFIFTTTIVLSLLLIGSLVTFAIYYLAMQSTISTIAKNINSNEKTQELSAELARKALESMVAISNKQQSTPVVNLSLPQAKTANGKEQKEEDDKVVKLHHWENG